MNPSPPTPDLPFLSYPYSQWTIGAASRNAHWQYAEWAFPQRFIHRNAPAGALAGVVRVPAGVPARRPSPRWGRASPVLSADAGAREPARRAGRRAALRPVRLPARPAPREQLQFSLQVHAPPAKAELLVEFDLKTKGEERGFIVRDKLQQRRPSPRADR